MNANKCAADYTCVEDECEIHVFHLAHFQSTMYKYVIIRDPAIAEWHKIQELVCMCHEIICSSLFLLHWSKLDITYWHSRWNCSDRSDMFTRWVKRWEWFQLGSPQFSCIHEKYCYHKQSHTPQPSSVIMCPALDRIKSMIFSRRT